MNSTTAAIVLFVGIIVVVLAVKGRVPKVWDAFLSGNIQETGSTRNAL